MNEERFEREHGATLEELRSARGPCPPAEDLLDWVDGALDPERAAAIERHVTLCSSCADDAARAREADPEVDDLSWQRAARELDRRRAAWLAPRRPARAGWLAAVAATIVVVAALAVYRAAEREALPPAPVAVTRDAEIVLLSPAGRVPALDELRWQGVPAPVRYRVEVTAPGDGNGAGDGPTLWQRVTTETRVRADEPLRALLESEPSLRWRVVVLDGEGHELERSAWLDFGLEQ